MKYRKRISKRGSKRLFKATAAKVNPKNVVRPNRGGVRF